MIFIQIARPRLTLAHPTMREPRQSFLVEDRAAFGVLEDAGHALILPDDENGEQHDRNEKQRPCGGIAPRGKKGEQHGRGHDGHAQVGNAPVQTRLPFRQRVKGSPAALVFGARTVLRGRFGAGKFHDRGFSPQGFSQNPVPISSEILSRIEDQ